MSDIYIPGVKSRLNTDQIIEDLMKVERVPRNRVEKNVERLETEKTYWQDVSRRITELRESARSMYSFQNPFNDRIVQSSNDLALTGTATREAIEQERYFTVKQTAQADRFLSAPLENNFRVEGGNYAFSVGENEISFDFRGGSINEFAEALNRRGKDKIQASLIQVKPGTKSLLIEGKVTGKENHLEFSGAALRLGQETGMVEQTYDSRKNILDGVLEVKAGEKQSLPVNLEVSADSTLVLSVETSTSVKPAAEWAPPSPPPGPDIPSAGQISYGGIVIQNEASSINLPVWTPPEPPKRVDDMNLLSLSFSDGSSARLAPIADSGEWNSYIYRLDENAGNKTIVSMEVVNQNTHRDVSVRNVQVFDPNSTGGIKPLNAVSTARDAVISMEGIEIERPSNNIDDLVPGVTLTVRSPSEEPIKLNIEPDREAVKDAVIGLVGNYNRLMAEINILTRTDPRVVEELSYLSKEEQDEYKTRLGTFMGDMSLTQFRSNLQHAATAPYPTSEDRTLALLSQIGVGADLRRGGATTGYDSSRLRGYLEIDEKILDSAIASHLPAIKELFGSDSDGDLIADTGVAFAIETMAKPYVDTGGLIALKTGTVDNKIAQENRRMETMDRQLDAKETKYRIQYGQMESAYNRMEQMSSSLDRFSQQNSGSGR